MLKEDSPNARQDSAQDFTVGVGKSVVLKSQSSVMTAVACVGGLLVPGLGHLLLGLCIRGVLLLVCVLLMFFLGLSMHGALSPPPTAEDLLSFKTLNVFANAGAGLAYVVALGRAESSGISTSETADYGWLFLVVAGLLNYLI